MDTPLLQPLPPAEWNGEKARHLLNRAGFGYPKSLANRLGGMGVNGAVDYLVDYEKVGESIREPDFLTPVVDEREIRGMMAGLSEEERKRKSQELRQAEREAVEGLKAWWVELMMTTGCPLREKMTLFWHGHFATSAQKVKSSQANYHINNLFRNHATGNFELLTIAVGQSPAMLRYLDNQQSTKAQPNENWARELMELFTLGQGHYTEADIKNSARAFTGWASEGGRFEFREGVHDYGMKVFMGRQGDFDGWDIIKIIFAQPAAAEFISEKLWTYFAYEKPEEAVVKGLAETLRANRYELKPMLRQIFQSRAFYGDRAIGTQVKSPVQFAVQLASDLGIDSPPYYQMTRSMAQLGQNLFYPPNVKGWDGNRAWANANTLFIRYNLPSGLVAAKFAKDRRMLAETERLDKRMASPETMTGQPRPMETMTAENRAMRREEKGLGRDIGVWDPASVLSGLRFETAGQCIDALEHHFLSVPLSAEQRRVLIDALGIEGGPTAPLKPVDLANTNIKAVLHLLLSTAEYQLC